MKKISLILLTIVFLFILVGCGINSRENGENTFNSETIGVTDEVTKDENDSNLVPKADGDFAIDKIIKNGRIELYTENYLKTLEKINMYVNGIGGFVQSSNDIFGESSISGYMIIRVPATEFSASMKELKSYGRVVGTSTNSENINEYYQDISSELKSLKIQEQRLLEYLTKADKVEDLLNIEIELNRVRTIINAKTSILNNYDKQVAYSTITINLTESKSATGNIESPFSDLGLKISSGFASSINLLMLMVSGIIVLFFRLLPFLVIIGVVLIIVWLVRKKIKK